jgi:hypothetical protein
MQTAGRTFPVHSEVSRPSFENGSILRITGICSVNVKNFAENYNGIRAEIVAVLDTARRSPREASTH